MGCMVKVWVCVILVVTLGICGPAGHMQAGDLLELRLDTFDLYRVDMGEALVSLRERLQLAQGRVAIAFESLPAHESGQGTISLSVRDGRVRDILDRLCLADPRYTWELVEGRLIYVYPKNGAADPAGLLDIRIAHLKVRGRYWPEAIISHIPSYCAELGEFLESKSREWARKHNRLTLGSAGSILTTNVPPPWLELELWNATVREVLIAISLYTLRHGDLRAGQVRKPEGPAVMAPVGWWYEFRVDPDASTGVGGYPTWRPF